MLMDDQLNTVAKTKSKVCSVHSLKKLECLGKMGWDAFLQTPVQKIMKNDILGQEGLRISQTLYYNY